MTPSSGRPAVEQASELLAQTTSAAAPIAATLGGQVGQLHYNGQLIHLYAVDYAAGGGARCFAQLLNSPPKMPLIDIRAAQLRAALGCCQTDLHLDFSPCNCPQADIPCAKAKVLRSINLALARIW